MSNRPSDVIYMSMPLYHSAALALGMGMAFGFGSKTIVRKKFSARNFFKDCAKYKVTVRQAEDTYRVTLVVADLCWVDYDFGHSTVCPVA